MVFSATTITITLLSVALAGVLSYVIGKWAFSVDTAAEARKRSAIKVSQVLSSMGLVRMPRVLECYAINDWSGLASELRSFAELAINEKAVVEEFHGVFKNVLMRQLALPEGRTMIAALLQDATQAGDPSVVSAVKATAAAVA